MGESFQFDVVSSRTCQARSPARYLEAMFTREDLVAALPTLIEKEPPRMEVISFLPYDFRSAASEEMINICRGPKTDFESALHFWVASQLCQKWKWTDRNEFFLPYLQEPACRPIGQVDFMILLDQTRLLKHPVVITPEGRYLRGQKMADEWDDSSAVAEFEHEFIAFNWETTA